MMSPGCLSIRSAFTGNIIPTTGVSSISARQMLGVRMAAKMTAAIPAKYVRRHIANSFWKGGNCGRSSGPLGEARDCPGEQRGHLIVGWKVVRCGGERQQLGARNERGEPATLFERDDLVVLAVSHQRRDSNLRQELGAIPALGIRRHEAERGLGIGR